MKPVRAAILAELPDAQALLFAIRGLRELGYRELEVRVPYEIAGLDEALGAMRPRRIPLWTLAGGLAGAIGAYALQYWISVVDLPLDVGGRPLHSAPAFIPITFESGVLAAGLSTFIGLIVHARLGRLWEPLDELDALQDASASAFWLVIDAADSRLDWRDTRRHLEELGAVRVEVSP